MSALKKWLDGELSVPLKAEWQPEKPAKKRGKKKKDDRQELSAFLKVYAVCAVVLCVAMACVLMVGIAAMPKFAEPGNPTDNEVVEHYVGSAEEETGAENVIAGMILNYRGFDTFGESCVLFVAVCCVMILLWATNDKLKVEAASSDEEASRDVILEKVCRLLLPCVLIFGICVLFNGHVSPGGGFSGGSILGAALILMSVAFGSDAVRKFFTMRVFNIVRITGLMIYAVLFCLYIYQGANGIDSSLSRYLVMVIDIAVGLVVMSTMFGFYSFFTKGDLR